MEKNSKKLFNGKTSARERRQRVVERLERQLKSGLKTVTQTQNGKTSITEASLSEKDKQRIEKELITLKTRI